ncbi:MAG: DUF3160 domain-containing protein [candidate division KSB1 bacterium]|nr:DUF3160 domain-containing protein [candidate division KSB1 bacterium]
MLAVMAMLVPAAATDAQMLAGITAPVQTEFGIYRPYPVSVVPAIPPYTLAPELSNVCNFSRFAFSAEELALLRQNQFVVTPRRLTGGGTGYKEVYDLYNECREQGIPILVTTDAMLHTFHLCFDYILKTCEEQRFFGDLNELLAVLLAQATRDYQSATLALARQAAALNVNYLIVAKALLDTNFAKDDNVLPPEARLYDEELELIYHPPGCTQWPSPLFGPDYLEDYTQYKPRGHYTRSDSLKHYFRAMMWLGRMTFACAEADKTLGALLLTRCLRNLAVGSRQGQEVWEDIYLPTVFFVGKSDDINFYQYDSLAAAVYGSQYTALDVDALADSAGLGPFMRLAQKLPGSKIVSGDTIPKGFRLMGQRFIPDSWVMDQLVYNQLPDRIWPRGLDVMAVLGSQRAYDLLAHDRRTFTGYEKRLNELRAEFAAYPPATWAQNVYWNWLYCLLPLLFPKGQGFPAFMQALAWVDKELFAALASWAELRHDTILYAKQSGTETGVRPLNALEQGYVEPNPWLYARLAALASYLRAGLQARGLLFENFRPSLQSMEDLLLNLKGIAEKELRAESLTFDEYRLICNIGETIETIVTFSLWPGGGPGFGEEDEMPVIADVHTEHNTARFLEVGVGYPYAIYAICPVEGQLKIAKGVGFAYYEFISPERLTDEQWREMLKKGQQPPHPEWAASFVAEAGWPNSNPMAYYPHKSGMVALLVAVNPDSVAAGGAVQVSIQSNFGYPRLSGAEVTAETRDGIVLMSLRATAQGDAYVATIPTAGFPCGRIWVSVVATLPGGWEMPDTLGYRTSFVVRGAQGVEGERQGPTGFALLPGYPNPTAGVAALRYTIPAAQEVELVVFDLKGRMVRTLAVGPQTAGEHVAAWDARDVPAGVYLVRLRAGTQKAWQKLIVTR